MSSLQGTKKQIALVGDRKCGKTSLAIRLSTGLYLDYYHPTGLVEDFTAEIDTGNTTCRLTLLDLAGTTGHDDSTSDHVRSLVYKNCDAVVLCFDLTNPKSLESVTSKWLPELEARCPGTPFILAGCKLDRTCFDAADVCVGTDVDPCPELALVRDEVKSILFNTRAKAYIEFSSKTMDGLEELVELVLDVAQKKRSAASKLAASIKRKLSLF